MQVYILDKPVKAREQISHWLSEDMRVREIKVFEDFPQLIKEIGKSPPHLSIIRLGNNGISGLKTAEMIKEENPNISIIFIARDRDYALDAYEVGADGYLLEPLEKEKLEQALLNSKKLIGRTQVNPLNQGDVQRKENSENEKDKTY